jgi:hypothetical protein
MNNTINLNSWEQVTKYIDNGFWKPSPSWFEHIIQHQGVYPRDAFSKGQLASKTWLLGELYRVAPLPSNMTVAILGCWIGTLVEPLHKALTIERIYGIDIDPHAIELSEKLNQRYVENSWKYKGVVADMSMLSTHNMEFTTGGELIRVKPECIINTSCEHMDNEWFESADNDQLIVMQTNNSPDFDGHINICEDVEHMRIKYPLTKTHFVGQLVTPAYTRYMQIGYK